MTPIATQPIPVIVRIGGANIMTEYVISSPSHPLYNLTSSTHPFSMCDAERMDYRNVEVLVLDPADHLQPIWDALLGSGHFITGQFGHNGVITLWASGGTARCDVVAMLTTVTLPSGTIQLESS